MATISAEGECFIIDGRRSWIVSGTLYPGRIPRPLWADRLRSARQCGLNTVEVPAHWAAIEPRPGEFKFTDQNDLASFVTIAAELGLRCILRAGPYIGDDFAMGGMPGWLISSISAPPRSADPSFLAPVARYFSALGDHLAKFQINGRSRLRVGPIILVQAEHEWLSHNSDDNPYMPELARLLREAGFTVPIISRNLLFNSTDSVIDTWSGYTNLFATVRQLRRIAPSQPSLVMGLRAGAPNAWGHEKRSHKTPNGLLRAIAEVIAAAGHVNIAPFHRGTLPAPHAGALPAAPDLFATTGGDTDTPLDEAGRRTPYYHSARLICTFARSFERHIAESEHDAASVSVSPDAVAPALRDDETAEPRRDPVNDISGVASVVRHGALGTIVFLFRDESRNNKNARTTILLPDGSSLPVYLGSRSVSWVLVRAHLFGRSTLDYCNLTPFLLAGESLVLVGPAGTPGIISVNNSPIEITVPTGAHPVVERHEGVTLIVASDEQAASIYAAEHAIYAGVRGIDASDQPLLADGQALRINPDGSTDRINPPKAAPPRTPRIDAIAAAPCDDFISGLSARYASIPGPDTLTALGADSGYGWMRLSWETGSAAKANLTFFECADRALVFHQSSLAATLGAGPAADGRTVAVPGAKGARTLAFLVESLGAPAAGSSLVPPKGIYGPPAVAKKLRVPAPHLENAEVIDPLMLFSPLMGVESGEVTHPRRVTFRVTHRRITPLAIHIESFDDRAVVSVNGSIVGWHERAGSGRIVIAPELLKRGINIVQFAVFEDPDTALNALKGAVSFLELDPKPFEKASWAFARWEPPAESAFTTITKAEATAPKLAKYKGTPTWWRLSFSTDDITRPLFFEAEGLTKGRMSLNGRDIGRYFVATHAGKPVPPQSRYYLPECWLHADKPNTLLIFDEHGAPPNKVSLSY